MIPQPPQRWSLILLLGSHSPQYLPASVSVPSLWQGPQVLFLRQCSSVFQVKEEEPETKPMPMCICVHTFVVSALLTITRLWHSFLHFRFVTWLLRTSLWLALAHVYHFSSPDVCGIFQFPLRAPVCGLIENAFMEERLTPAGSIASCLAHPSLSPFSSVCVCCVFVYVCMHLCVERVSF